MLAAIIIILFGVIFLYPFSFDAKPNPAWGGNVYFYASGPIRWERNDAIFTSMGLDTTVDSEEYQKLTEVLDKYSYHRGINSIFNKVIIKQGQHKDHKHNDGWCEIHLSLNHAIRINCNGRMFSGKKMTAMLF